MLSSKIRDTHLDLSTRLPSRIVPERVVKVARTTVGNSHGERPIEIEGVPYASITAARRALKCGVKKIYDSLDDGTAKYLNP